MGCVFRFQVRLSCGDFAKNLVTSLGYLVTGDNFAQNQSLAS